MNAISFEDIYSNIQLSTELRVGLNQYLTNLLAVDEILFDYFGIAYDSPIPVLWIITNRRVLWINEVKHNRKQHIGWSDAGYLFDDLDLKVTYIPPRFSLFRRDEEQVVVQSTKGGRGNLQIENRLGNRYGSKGLKVFADNLQLAITEWHDNKRAINIVTDQKPQVRDFAAKLKDLNELRLNGGLTDEEYQQAKRKILEE